jgi:hypothetical protein
MKPAKTAYQSYLLRMWCEDQRGEWRATLEDVASGAYHNFPNMASLFTFLNCQTLPQGSKISIQEWDPKNANRNLKPKINHYSEEEVG